MVRGCQKEAAGGCVFRLFMTTESRNSAPPEEEREGNVPVCSVHITSLITAASNTAERHKCLPTASRWQRWTVTGFKCPPSGPLLPSPRRELSPACGDVFTVITASDGQTKRPQQ